MPERGTWQRVPAGTERLKRVALASLVWKEDEVLDILAISWERFSPEFLARLQALGQSLKDAQSS